MKVYHLPWLICTLVACRTECLAGGGQADVSPDAAPSLVAHTDTQRHRGAVRSGDSSVFPRIHPQQNGFHLGVIEAYCKRHRVGRLGRERVRMFVQPSGTVESAIEVDLRRRRVRVLPEWWTDRREAFIIDLRPEDLDQVRALVTADEFDGIPAENSAFGLDGCAYLIESTVGGHYSWKLHWESEDPAFLKAVRRLAALNRRP